MAKQKYGKNSLESPIVWGLLGYRLEIIGVLVVSFLVFLAASVFSYSPTDSSWFYFSSGTKDVANWCGVVGAHIAALSFFLFGSASFILLLCLGTLAYFLFFRETFMRLVTLPVLLLISATLFRMHRLDFITREPGGLVGRFQETIFLEVFGRVGSFLVLYSMAWVCFLLLAQISIITFLKTVGGAGARLATTGGLFLFFSWKMLLKKLRRKKAPVYVARDEFLFLQNTAQAREKEQRLHGPVEPLAPVEPIREPEVSYSLPDFSQFQEMRVVNLERSEFEKKCRDRGTKLEEKLQHFGVKGCVTAIRPGPVVTLFEYKPEIDSKISKIIALEDDLAMALTALSIRIIAPIPGRSVVGFEISNQVRQDVFLSDVLTSESQLSKEVALPLALGVDITGNPEIQDLAKMPHVLVAGSTGSGKSVGLNAMLVSLLCRLTPNELKLILIDPKRLEFAPYADIPHLLFPIVTSPHKAIPVLKWVVQEMEDRYDCMAKVGARSIFDYNKLVPEKMSFIMIMIDELADLMMVAGKDVETQIARTAQMARAAGIHMIVATQRPSVDVLTGIIKVNFPARIAFRVSSKIDSRTILDGSGAEKLLGRGDMLFLNSGASAPKRVHGAYVSSAEISRLTGYLRKQQAVSYLEINEVLRRASSVSANDFEDSLYDGIKSFLQTVDEVSISMLQRKYRIGFNRSARIIEQLELDGLVAPSQGGKTRKVLRED
ncbi:DNA translocase FtsK [Candidatus Dependentiae bacterium]|nr:DNA translocase FtsK [Candidatus Dependentiae bacterium]